MGTTVTTHLGLIKPDGDESIKEDLPTFPGWAAQNEDNCDAIDGLFRTTAHTPTLNWTADTLNPTLGAGGFTEYRVRRIYPGMMMCWFRILTGGAGFAAGTGTYRLNLPVGMHSTLANAANLVDPLPIGKAILLDNDTVATSTVMLVMYGRIGGSINLRSSTGAAWTPTVPFTLAQNDRVSGYFMYPTSDA